MQLSEPLHRYTLQFAFVVVCLQAGRCSDEAVGPTTLYVYNVSESSDYTTNELNSTETDNGTAYSSTQEPAGFATTIGVNGIGNTFDNDSIFNSNITTSAASTKVKSWWLRFRNAGVIFMASTGVVANTLTVVTLTINGRAFSRPTAILLKHQAILDLLVCALACGVFLQTSVWNVGVRSVDVVVCFLWHNMLGYWTVVLLSTWNLVFIAVDRLVAVCLPTKCKTLFLKKIKIAIAAMYVPCIAVNMVCITNVSFRQGRCSADTFLTPDIYYKFNYWASIYCLFLYYIVPVILFVVCYGRIVLRLRQHRIEISSNIQSQSLTVSVVRVTKCAIAVTVTFIASMGFQGFYYCIASVGVTSFDFRGPLHLLGILLTLSNSFANPFFYAIFMPAFRRSLWTTVRWRRNEVQDISITPGSTA